MRVNQSALPPRGRPRALLSAALVLLAVAPGCVSRRREVPAAGAPHVPEYLGDAARSGSADEELSSEPRERWRAQPGRGTLGAVAVGDSVVVVASVDRWASALDARTGHLFWRVRADGPLGAGPAVGDGRVFVAEQGGGGRVLAIRLRDGKKIWRQKVGEVSAPILLDRGTVYGVTRRGIAFALRAEDGRPRWQRMVGSGSRTGPLLVGGRVTLVTVADTLVVLDAVSGRVVSRRGLPAGVLSPLARIDDSTIAVASPVGALMAVRLPRGDVRWRVDVGAPVFGAPVVLRDTVYALTNRCTLWAVPTGRPTRADTLPMPSAPPEAGACTTVAAPALVRGGVLVATVSGHLIYVSRATRRVVWTRQTRGELRHPPGIRNGHIVVAPLLGDVVSFR